MEGDFRELDSRLGRLFDRRLSLSLEGWTDDPSSEAGTISGFILGLKQVCLLDKASKLLERVIAASLEEDLSKVLPGL